MDTNMEDVGRAPADVSPVANEPATIPTLDGWIESLMNCKQLAEADVQRLCDKVSNIEEFKEVLAMVFGFVQFGLHPARPSVHTRSHSCLGLVDPGLNGFNGTSFFANNVLFCNATGTRSFTGRVECPASGTYDLILRRHARDGTGNGF